jgi:hypothetical protein
MTKRILKPGEYIDDQGSIRDAKGQLVEPPKGSYTDDQGLLRDKDGKIIAGIHLRDPRIAEEEQAEREFRRKYYQQKQQEQQRSNDPQKDST